MVRGKTTVEKAILLRVPLDTPSPVLLLIVHMKVIDYPLLSWVNGNGRKRATPRS